MFCEWFQKLLALAGLCHGILRRVRDTCLDKVVLQLVLRAVALSGSLCSPVQRGMLAVALLRLHAEVKCVPALFAERDPAPVLEGDARLGREPRPVHPHARETLVLDRKRRTLAPGLVKENAMFRAHLGVVDRKAAAPASADCKREMRHVHKVARTHGGSLDSERG